jgi:Zn-dependent protease with chaperone function
MIAKNYRRTNRLMAWLAIGAMLLTPLSVLAQTRISYHSNKFKPTDDVKLGRQAAQEAEQQLPILRDRLATDYVSSVGQRLVASIPHEFRHPEFQYYFKIVNASDINAFALPGGPMYVNRGMIEAAHNEGEMAGVMAHELSHVALRHGTAQATKAQKYSLLAGILGIGGAIIGGPVGTVAQLGAQGVGIYFLKFSREYETEADVLGSQIMARAGYDPHDLANMFKTIERTSGGGGGFLSDHPSPANRYERINQEAQYLRVVNPIRDTREFDRVQARLHSYPRAPSTTEILRSGQRYPVERDNGRYPDDNGRGYPNDDRYPNDNRYPDNRRYPANGPTGRVAFPSSRYRNYSEFGGLLRVSVPDNWRELNESNSTWFAPEGAYGQVGGQAVFTHGINFSVSPSQGQDFETEVDQAVRNLQQSNPGLRRLDRYNRVTVNGRYWMSTRFSNTNEATGRPETVAFFATQLRNGNILYIFTAAPQNESGEFQSAFNRIINSVQLND